VSRTTLLLVILASLSAAAPARAQESPAVLPKAAKHGPGTRVPFVVEEEPTLTNGEEVARAIERAYPPALLKAGVGGTASLVLRVTRDGKVDTASVTIRASRPEFATAAIDRFPAALPPREGTRRPARGVGAPAAEVRSPGPGAPSARADGARRIVLTRRRGP